MTLIVEDGTGLSTAESYIAVADADTWHSNRGNTAWAALLTADKEAALRKATDYMVAIYRERWAGFKRRRDQALDWPRWDVWVDEFPVDPDSVPSPVKNACAYLALQASTTDLAPALDRPTVSETVGSISVEYERGAPQFKRYRQADLMVAPYISGGTTNSKLIRG